MLAVVLTRFTLRASAVIRLGSPRRSNYSCVTALGKYSSIGRGGAGLGPDLGLSTASESQAGKRQICFCRRRKQPLHNPKQDWH
jgi:hypothetical protein